MTLSFGLTASSALQELRTNADFFNRDELNETLARDCAQKAWHLCDLFFNEVGPTSSFKDLPSFKSHVRKVCPDLDYLRDICIASKHGKITRYKPSIDDARYHDGDFCREDFDPHDFSVPRLAITLHDGQQLLFDDVLESVVVFWRNLFSAHGILKMSP